MQFSTAASRADVFVSDPRQESRRPQVTSVKLGHELAATDRARWRPLAASVPLGQQCGGFASARPVLAEPESRILCLEATCPRMAIPITVYVPLCRNTHVTSTLTIPEAVNPSFDMALRNLRRRRVFNTGSLSAIIR